MKEIKCQAISDYQSTCPDPLIITRGEILKIETKKSKWKGWIWCINQFGKGGWVPEKYIEKLHDKCKVLKDYNATELTVKAGEVLIISYEESGWAWVTNENGECGWVPLENVQIFKK